MLDLEPWHDLFVMSGSAAAALAGLLFVAVSLNLEHVLKYNNLPALAAQSVAVLIELVLLSAFALAPDQGPIAFGAEVLATGAALAVIVLVPNLRSLAAVDRRAWKARRVVVAVAPTVPVLVAGVLLLVGASGALDWLLAEIVTGLTVSAYNAWVLLVEIRR